ncbi:MULTISPECIES: sodium/pantothenate symporter [Psychrilyobacter]|uniref:Sodium/panthothenate symporter n=1 Tax=Psychrilyobacter piezotolerans TaxID=2293438 RepID=A0ABX9KFX1_9FUSO|nr:MULTISPECIES: sodium/pantothenate symporter [Psychrilyobacter]MCS5421608.1 sodium/pantothenate symporter [Psychrilyobacter sp. S5]NDI78180.1 sodium/panthothenate symporter [Psychrilyobacter piezotolerans]RDE60128.1 sodium/panthothenate symporter [Psychrilyobacter sp. S5]REI40310.1 sodium/panthothenate symporter [Psychrilyobacter piezotolerans]
MEKIKLILPLLIYLGVTLYIAYYNSPRRKKSKNFTNEYFIGNRSMGGFVLAMTVIATYTGASSFLGGPGVAYKLGLGWVLLASIQIPTAFLTLGILGKKLAIISRKIDGITINDFLRARYQNKWVVIMSSTAILLFFMAYMVVQVIGGARLFEVLTGLDYTVGLVIFGFAIIFYTVFGGFKTVAITDAIQGVIMLVTSIILFWVLKEAGGGMRNIMKTIYEIDPNLLTPSSGGAITKPFIMSFWVLVGVGLLGLPQTTIRCMGFRDSRSLHRAMVIGTFVVGFLMIMMHLIGVMGIAIIPKEQLGDKVIPILAIRNLSPVLLGVFIGGPLAAIMSTVDSLLIQTSSTIVKDIYINYIAVEIDEKKLSRISLWTTLIMGVMVFALAFHPPEFIVWLNLFALGGLEAVFMWPILLGLYWKKANSTGALLSMGISLLVYVSMTILKIKFFGMHQIVPTIAVGGLVFVIGSYSDKSSPEEHLEIFFE